MKKIFGVLVISSLLISCGEKTAKDTSEKVLEKASTSHSAGELVIGFYNSDSIPANFNFYKVEEAALEKEGRGLESQLVSKQQGLQNLYNRYQSGMQNQSLTPNQMETLGRQIQEAEAGIARFQQEQLGAFQNKQMESTIALQNKVKAYSNEFAKEKGITLFLILGQGASTAYVDEAYDFTSEFIAYMNEKEDALNADLNK